MTDETLDLDKLEEVARAAQRTTIRRKDGRATPAPRIFYECAENCLRLIALARTSVPEGWRPIESAPRDGTAFLIWIEPGRADVTYWAHRYSSAGGLMNHENSRVTHWQPLPAPPATSDAP